MSKEFERIEETWITVRDGGLNVHRIRPSQLAVGQPLVLLHDALGSIPQWRTFPTDLADRCRREVVVYERRGHGASSPLPGQRTADYLHREALDYLPDLLETLHIERPVLIGHSDGGSIALIYAACHRPAAVVTLAAHVLVENKTLAGIQNACGRRDQLIEKLRPYHGGQTETLFDAWADTWLDPAFRNWNITGLLPEIDCPALIIQGSDDAYGSTDQVRHIVKGIGAAAQSLLLSGCGHAPHQEQPDRVLAAIAGFLGIC